MRAWQPYQWSTLTPQLEGHSSPSPSRMPPHSSKRLWQTKVGEKEEKHKTASVKETGLLAAKVDLRIKRLDDHATKLTKGTVQTMGSHMKCEVCGDVGHLGNNCPKTQEETSYINDGFHQHQQPGNNGWNNHNHPQGNSSNFNTNYDFNHLSLRSFVLEQPEFNAYLAKNFPSMIECLNLKMLSLKLCLLLLNVGWVSIKW